jgi:hypothetical protein
MSTEEYRKESSFSLENFLSLPNLRLLNESVLNVHGIIDIELIRTRFGVV